MIKIYTKFHYLKKYSRGASLEYHSKVRGSTMRAEVHTSKQEIAFPLCQVLASKATALQPPLILDKFDAPGYIQIN